LAGKKGTARGFLRTECAIPVVMDWEPQTKHLRTFVNQRDLYGWPFPYFEKKSAQLEELNKLTRRFAAEQRRSV
jgi:hypothetical protein